MRNILCKLSAALFVGASLVTVVSARPATARALNASPAPQIDARERRQQRRIRRGVRSGELTRREARHLERRERRIDRQESRMRRSGGGMNWRERRRLNRELNRSSRAIRRQRHDRQERR